MDGIAPAPARVLDAYPQGQTFRLVSASSTYLNYTYDSILILFKLVACSHCALARFPCYRQLGIAIACVRCRAQHTQCSQTFRKDGNNIENPYAHMLARYMLSWQIHYFEQGKDLIIAYRDFTGCSLMPGVPLKFMPGMRAGKSKEKEAVAVARSTRLSTLKNWEEYWLGADYEVMARTWRFINSGAKGSEEVALKRTPQFGELLPENIQQDIDSYYEKLVRLDPEFKLSDLDDDDDDDDDDEDDDDDGRGGGANDDENQSVAGSDTTSAARVEDDLNGVVGDDDNADEIDEFDNDDTIVVVHSDNTSLVDDAPLISDGNVSSVNVNDASLPYNAPTSNLLPPPVDDAPPPIDDAPPSINDTLPPTNDFAPSFANVLSPTHVASVFIPPSADDIDDVLTPIDDSPSPIDVDVRPLTNDGPSVEDVDDVLPPVDDIPLPIDADVPPLVNDQPPPAADSDVPPPVPPQEDVVMHESDQDAEVEPDALNLSGMCVSPIT